MQQIIDGIQYVHHGVSPSIRGLILVVVPGLLSATANHAFSFMQLNWWEMLQWTLSVVVACYGIYDFHLKVRYKHRGERAYKDAMKKKTEELKNAKCNGKAD